MEYIGGIYWGKDIHFPGAGVVDKTTFNNARNSLFSVYFLQSLFAKNRWKGVSKSPSPLNRN